MAGGVPHGSAGWNTWGAFALAVEEALEHERELADNPLACPEDGEPLIDADDGHPFCRYCGWRP